MTVFFELSVNPFRSHMSQDAGKQEFRHRPWWVLSIFHSEFPDGLASFTITVLRAFSFSFQFFSKVKYRNYIASLCS